jgi:hypothetical protein
MKGGERTRDYFFDLLKEGRHRRCAIPVIPLFFAQQKHAETCSSTVML